MDHNNENNDLEKEELEKAAESLKNVNFNQDNYKSLIEIINKIKELTEPTVHTEDAEINEKETAVPYITDKGNIFVAKENLNSEEFDKYAKETDIEAEKEPQNENNTAILPEFAMITQHGLQTFSNFHCESHNIQEHSYTLSNGETTIKVEESTFNEIVAPSRFENNFDENTPAYKKLLETQYNDYFQQRDNTANSFIHNLKCYIRKEANSPLDAMEISKQLVERMDKREQKKTQQLLNQLKRDDETITDLLLRTYYEAVKEVPLNEQFIKQNMPDKFIVRPFYDVINANGQLVDKNSTLKIGDTIKNIPFEIQNLFDNGKSKFHEALTVVSSSKEGNNIILMDGKKSYYEIPRDNFLEGYNKQQTKIHNAERKHQNRNEYEVER